MINNLRSGLAIWLVATAFILTTGPALADTLHVPAPYATIQAAIDAATAGDVVEIADGTYTGEGNKDLDFGGRAITVRGASGDPALCVIDCENNGRGFSFHSEEGADSRVEGLTITNGYVYGSIGGGVYCYFSSPTLTNCSISGNSTGYSGGGVRCYYSNLTLTNCTINGNSANDHGGGVYCEHSNLTLTDCTISGNSTNTLNGGGICCYGSSYNLTLTNCTIRGNTAGYAGGGVYCTGSSSNHTLINCTISGNSASDGGGGVCCDGASNIQILSNCTISGNSACNNGGGVDCYYGSPTLTDCTISENSALAGGGVRCVATLQPSAMIQIGL